MAVTRKSLIEGSPYRGYLYAYPHKSAYRTFEAPRALEDLWREERKDNLFLYLHVPFCEMRCGFCNLFTATGADESKIERYLSALERETRAIRAALGHAHVAQAAIGGGTPTYLPAKDLARLFDIAAMFAPAATPLSIETSPSRTTPDRLAVLKERGVRRVSIGVESFDEAELKALARPAAAKHAMTALDALRATGFHQINIDLIYGAAGQSIEAFLASIDRALEWRPEEIYLYPLYVRTLTGLSKTQRQNELDAAWDEQRLVLYRAGRDRLRAEGYVQQSMRHFRVPNQTQAVAADYLCQQDGMVGLGPGARSYTSRVHYSTPYAVSRAVTWKIIDDYLARDDFTAAAYGIELSLAEQQRRFLIKSLLQADGFDATQFARTYAVEAHDRFPELKDLVDLGLAERFGATIKLTEVGLERSDAIGPFLVSADIAAQMDRFEWH